MLPYPGKRYGFGSNYHALERHNMNRNRSKAQWNWQSKDTRVNHSGTGKVWIQEQSAAEPAQRGHKLKVQK